MAHKIHTFRAATMDEAINLIRRKLGMDAVVVDSKEVAIRRLLPWPSTRLEFEVTAERRSRTSEANASHKPESKRVVAPRTVRTLAESRLSMASMPAVAESTLVEASKPIERTEEQLAPAPEWLVNPSVEFPNADQIDLADDLTKSRFTESRLIVSETFDAPSTQNTCNSNPFESLMSLLEMQTQSRGLSEIPFEYRQLFLQLVEADIDDMLAREMIATLTTDSSWIKSPADVTTTLTAFVEQDIECTSPIQPKPGRREIVTVIGPTGVGKTTVIAKLAAQFQLHEGRSVGLITVDNYRIGAIDQIRAYAEILQAPLRSASTSEELRAAIDSLDDVDVILIDTAGQSPRDRSKVNALCKMLEVVPADHVLLVLSLTGGAKQLGQVARQFAAIRPTALVVTKLDEAAGCGGLLNLSRHISLPFQYVTTGQDVPDMIEPANPSRIARLILGTDQITASVKPE